MSEKLEETSKEVKMLNGKVFSQNTQIQNLDYKVGHNMHADMIENAAAQTEI